MFCVIVVFYQSIVFANREEKSSTYVSDKPAIPLSPREIDEIKNDGFIKNRLEIISVKYNGNEVVLEGELQRFVFSLVNNIEDRTPLYMQLKIRANVVFPKELLNGENLSNCILEGESEGDIGVERIIIRDTRISCKKKKLKLKKKALWFSEDGRIGLKGIIINTGLRDSKAEYLHTDPKSFEETVQQSIDHAENVIPGIVVRRNTRVTIVFPNERIESD